MSVYVCQSVKALKKKGYFSPINKYQSLSRIPYLSHRLLHHVAPQPASSDPDHKSSDSCQCMFEIKWLTQTSPKLTFCQFVSWKRPNTVRAPDHECCEPVQTICVPPPMKPASVVEPLSYRLDRKSSTFETFFNWHPTTAKMLFWITVLDFTNL